MPQKTSHENRDPEFRDSASGGLQLFKITKQLIDKGPPDRIDYPGLSGGRVNDNSFHYVAFPRGLDIRPITLSPQSGGGSHEVPEMRVRESSRDEVLRRMRD
jgi:hypothetical protein